ncbi:MAG: HPr family phosphocarrier protein [Clostridia bacterium]|nr:HPr family phosphocarrier protein [Clostridia bacterium]
MVEKQLKVGGDVLRSKKAGDFVEIASEFNSSIYLEVENRRVNAKSIIGVLSMNLTDGDNVNVLVSGADEEKAISAIEEYIV